MSGSSRIRQNYMEGERSEIVKASRLSSNRGNSNEPPKNHHLQSSREEKELSQHVSGNRPGTFERKRSIQGNRSPRSSPKRPVQSYRSRGSPKRFAGNSPHLKENLTAKDVAARRQSYGRGIQEMSNSMENEKFYRSSKQIRSRSRSNDVRSISSFSISSRSPSVRSRRSPVRIRRHESRPYGRGQSSRNRRSPSERALRGHPSIRRSRYASSVSSFSSSSIPSRWIHRRNVANKSRRHSLIAQSTNRSTNSSGKYRDRNRTKRVSSTSDSDEESTNFAFQKSQQDTSGKGASIEIGGSGPEVVGGAARKLQSATNASLLSKEKRGAKHDNAAIIAKGALASLHTEEPEEKPLEMEDARLHKYMNEEVKQFVEAEIQRRLKEIIDSPVFKQELEKRIEEERQCHLVAMRAEIEVEKKKSLDESRRKEAEERRSKQQLEEIMAENERKVREEQRRLAEEQAKADEERLLELQKMQQAREEERRKKLINSKGNSATLRNQINANSAPSARQKLAFKINSGVLGV